MKPLAPVTHTAAFACGGDEDVAVADVDIFGGVDRLVLWVQQLIEMRKVLGIWEVWEVCGRYSSTENDRHEAVVEMIILNSIMVLFCFSFFSNNESCANSNITCGLKPVLRAHKNASA